MNEVDSVKKALETIQKYGDMYDLVNKAKNTKPYDNAIVRFNILLFSRIWFLGLLLKDKIAAKNTKFAKINEATEIIRSAAGVNIDIIIPKYKKDLRSVVMKRKVSPMILFENSGAFMDEYLDNLKKILSFMSLYDIPYAFLLLEDINKIFPSVDLSPYVGLSIESLFHKISFEDKSSVDYVVVDKYELEKLIKYLESYKVDKKFIMSLGRRISDEVIKNALDNFQEKGDIDALKNVFSMRLALSINSDNSYKTKDFGKASDMVDIFDEYVRVITTYTNKPQNETVIMLLCEYLGFPNYDALLKSINNSFDDEEKNLMAVIYLYLCRKRKNENLPLSDNKSYFDRIYASLMNNDKYIENTHSKAEKFSINLVSMMISLYFTAAVVASGFFSCFLIDFANQLIKKNEDSNLTKSVSQAVITPYKYSYEFEKSLVAGLLNGIEDAKMELSDGISSFIGDSFGIKQENKIVGVIEPLNGTLSCDLPTYFACEYGTSSTYEKGNIEYNLVNPNVKYNEFSYSDSLFDIEVYFTKRELRQMIEGNTITIPYALYPVEDSYFISLIAIQDDKDENKVVVITSIRADYYQGALTQEEKDILYSMKKPKIVYYYALEPHFVNSFVTSMEKDGTYLSLDHEEMVSTIKGGLGLSEDASLNDIFASIKSKYYSTTPFKDAKITSEIKKYDEKEFIEKVASLDSLVCNLAATLAVESSEELYYVVGFNTSDKFITYGNAHAWAMNKYGELIDVTPTSALEKEEDNNIVSKLLNAALENGLPLIGACILISSLLGNALKKRVSFKIKVCKVNKYLKSKDKNATYAFINETLYGGINMPSNMSSEDLLEALSKDFAGFSKEDLKNLLNELKSSQDPKAPQARRVVKLIPFIKQNGEKLVRSLNKKKK